MHQAVENTSEVTAHIGDEWSNQVVHFLRIAADSVCMLSFVLSGQIAPRMFGIKVATEIGA